jgi:hypothetical protein
VHSTWKYSRAVGAQGGRYIILFNNAFKVGFPINNKSQDYKLGTVCGWRGTCEKGEGEWRR